MLDRNTWNHLTKCKQINFSSFKMLPKNYLFTSSCHAAYTDLLDPISPPVSIVHRSREVFQATSCIGTKLLYIGSSWLTTFARPCEGVPSTTSLMSSSLLLQQRSACLVRLTCVVSRRWPYSCCFVGCCLQDLFNTACSILV